jgi:hypothetical protein
MRASILSSLVLLFFFCLIGASVRGQSEFTATGEYQGKSVYVQNPLSADRKNFCVQSVYLNEQLVTSSPRTSAFLIDLSELQKGDPVFIKIVHKEGCIPKIINPQVIRTRSKFYYLSTTVDEISINWVSSGEIPDGKFVLEHYKNDRWHAVDSIAGHGSFGSNQYTLAPNHHTGDNKYRLIYHQSNGQVFYSRVFDFFFDVEPVSFYPTSVDDHITLSRETEYEIRDSFGNAIATGKSNKIDLPSNLKSGLYFLHIDNRKERFFKK